MGLTYEQSGVNIAAGNKAVGMIKPIIEKTFGLFPGKIINGVGGFAAIIEYGGIILIVSTDGVGTKLRTAFVTGLHNKVGIDLVAMVLNDILVYGATYGIFLDYIAQNNQLPDRTFNLISGMANGCFGAGFALPGGEMAELPGFYKENEYDLAGFGVGFLPNRDHLILGTSIRPGTKAYGLASSGLHSNGFSLVWEVFGIDFNNPLQAAGILYTHYPELGHDLITELSEPTCLYQQMVRRLIDKYEVTGMANITGGGLVENPQRILPPGCSVKINWGSWPIPRIFSLIQERGDVAEEEMRRVFNNGIGFIVYSPDEIDEPGVYKIGEVVEGNGEVIFV